MPQLELNMPEQKLKVVMDYLSVYIGIDEEDARQNILLMRAIEYAGIEDYIIQPTNHYEGIKNDIFLIKVKSFFKRKLLENNSHKEIHDIQNYEFSQVRLLKSKLPPEYLK